MVKKLLFLSLPILLFSNQFEQTLQDEIQWLEEETFVVSASRVKESIKKAPASITVIDEEMIDSMGVDTLSELLNTVSGISVTQSNIYIKEIAFRGIKDFTSKQVLFMIDGHSLDAYLLNGGGSVIVDQLPLDTIKRVEIIKGPASALYGANAFTGLVNIITKKASDINGFEVLAKTGSYDTKQTNILYGKSHENLSIVSNINVYKSDGNRVHVKEDRANNSGDTNPYIEQYIGNLRIDYKNVYFSSMFQKRDDGSYFGPLGELSLDNNPNTEYLFTEIGHNLDINSKLNLSSRVYYDRFSIDNRWHLLTVPSNKDMVNAAKNQKVGFEALATYRITDEFVSTFGTTYEDHKQYDIVSIENGVDNSNTSNAFAPSVKRDMWALYLNNLYDMNSTTRLTLGARYDEYSDFGSNLAPRGGLSWQMNKHNTLKFLYGEGFRAPTFAEIFNNGSVITGNTKLTPEKVKTYEVSLENSLLKNVTAKVTLFHNKFEDLITKSGTQYVNSGKVETQGIELDTKYDLHRGSYILANFTYQQAKDKVTSSNLPNIAKHKANLFFNYRINKYLNSFNHLFLKGKTKRASGDSRADVSEYALFNTSLVVKNIYKTLNIKASINNLFDEKAYDPSDKDYTNDDYEKKGRNFMVELKYKF